MSLLLSIAELCAKTQTPFKHPPSWKEASGGFDGGCTPRETDWARLLGRDPVRIDLDAVRDEIQGRVILITGAAGTIGMELCRQVLRFAPSKLVCVDRNENGVFYLQLEVTAQRRKSQI